MKYIFTCVFLILMNFDSKSETFHIKIKYKKLKIDGNNIKISPLDITLKPNEILKKFIKIIGNDSIIQTIVIKAITVNGENKWVLFENISKQYNGKWFDESKFTSLIALNSSNYETIFEKNINLISKKYNFTSSYGNITYSKSYKSKKINITIIK